MVYGVASLSRHIPVPKLIIALDSQDACCYHPSSFAASPPLGAWFRKRTAELSNSRLHSERCEMVVVEQRRLLSL